MINEEPILKYRFLESSIDSLSKLGQDPKDFLDSSFGIQVRNFGEEVKIVGKTKFVAFGEEDAVISTGIKIIVPEGYYATFVETQDILHTSLSVRPVIFKPGFNEEVKVSFFNAGEREVVVPPLAPLPVALIAKPFCKISKVVSDLEYLESAPAPKSPGADN